LSHISFSDLSAISLTRLTAKFDAGGLDVTFVTGESLGLEVRHYRELSECLRQIQRTA